MSADDADPKTATLGTAAGSTLRPVVLRVVEGPDLGRTATVTAGTAVIGTRADCQLVLTDTTVSRRHASVELLGPRVRVRDLGSKNGTQYLGAKVDAVDVPLGATVSIGGTQVALLPQHVAEERLSDRTELFGMLGRSPAMQRLFARIEQVAPGEAPVLVVGETGTGKELVAQALHALSARAPGPLRVFDCAASQGELAHSALFGHKRGAFTGAVADSAGALEEAHGGTLFLDEVGELPLSQQAMFLRALESGSFRRLGEQEDRRSDLRLVAATHRDLAAMVAKGEFRADLYHRLASVVLEVPPLRDRPGDVPLLAEHFARRRGEARLAPETVAMLCAYAWPGNVRELRNVVDRSLSLEALPGQQESASLDFKAARDRAVTAFEKSYLEFLLDRHEGSVAAAAREAGLTRSYFYELLQRHGLVGARPRR